MNDDLISRSALKKTMEEERQYLLARGQKGAEHILVHHCLPIIDNAPAVEYTFEEAFQKTVCDQKLYCPKRPVGHWINGYKSFNCSVCGKIAYSWNHFGEYIQVKSNFCPHCGADMRGKEE